MRLLRFAAISAIAMAFATAQAQQTLVHLTAYPTVSVADGRSTSTITAELRDSGGKLVADGTRVVFNTTLGTFRESIVTTTNGIARAILVSDGRAGVAQITATPLSGAATPANLEFEFVADRAMLSSAREYVEIVAPGLMHYTADNRVIGAAGVNKGVTLRYRDITVEADDLQLTIPSYELRARKARVHVGKIVREYDALYFQLNVRKGYGLTTFEAKKPKFPVPQGKGVAFVYEATDGTYRTDEAPTVTRFGLVEVKGSAISPASSAPGPDAFELSDLSFATSRISAKKAVIFPQKQIQFHRAQLYVADSKVVQLPLFQLNLANANTPLITESLINVTDSNIALDYPHYLSLKPGQTSLLRFRTGNTYDRGQATGQGAWLDYELNWNRGDEMDGGLSYRGIGRSDWSIGVRQYNRFDNRTSGFLQLDFPAAKSLFGSGSLSHEFDGFHVSLNGNANQTLRGIRQSYRDLNFVGETSPIRIGKLPLQAFYGVTASTSQRSIENVLSQEQSTAGVRARLQSSPIRIEAGTTMTTAFSVSQVTGTTYQRGLQITANTTLSRRINNNTSALLSYDFTRDGYNDRFVGMHRLSAQTYMTLGRTSVRLLHSRSLDIDRMNIFGDVEYQPSRSWILRGSYTMDRYGANDYSSSFQDMQFSFGYVLGWREIGLVYSKRSGRIGLQLLGAGGY